MEKMGDRGGNDEESQESSQQKYEEIELEIIPGFVGDSDDEFCNAMEPHEKELFLNDVKIEALKREMDTTWPLVEEECRTKRLRIEEPHTSTSAITNDDGNTTAATATDEVKNTVPTDDRKDATTADDKLDTN